MSSVSAVERIKSTLDHFDPQRQTILVGGASIELALASRGITDHRPLDDVDVLCSEQFFNALVDHPRSIEGIEKFQLRWPKGRLAQRGAKNMSIDLYPSSIHQERGVTAFTACHTMSDFFYPITYESCKAHHTTHYLGERSMQLAEILRWIAIIGREKDLVTIEQVLPISRDIGLITESEQETILREYTTSTNAALFYPERYYPRVY